MPAEILSAPGGSEWRHFLARTFGVLAAGALLAAAVCFIAYNWNDMGVSVKFALVESAMLGLAGLSLWLGLENRLGSMTLFAAVFLAGPLLAVYGQAYPTGAPLSKLLFIWAGIAAAAAALARTQGLWLLALAVLNAALLNWAPLNSRGGLLGFHGAPQVAAGLCDLGAWGLALALPAWMPSPNGRRLLVSGAAFFLNIAMMKGGREMGPEEGILFFFAAGLGAYAMLQRRLFELVLVFLSALCLLNVLMLRVMRSDDYLLLTVLNLLAGTVGAYALNRFHQDWKDQP